MLLKGKATPSRLVYTVYMAKQKIRITQVYVGHGIENGNARTALSLHIVLFDVISHLTTYGCTSQDWLWMWKFHFASYIIYIKMALTQHWSTSLEVSSLLPLLCCALHTIRFMLIFFLLHNTTQQRNTMQSYEKIALKRESIKTCDVMWW